MNKQQINRTDLTKIINQLAAKVGKKPEAVQYYGFLADFSPEHAQNWIEVFDDVLSKMDTGTQKRFKIPYDYAFEYANAMPLYLDLMAKKLAKYNLADYDVQLAIASDLITKITDKSIISNFEPDNCPFLSLVVLVLKAELENVKVETEHLHLLAGFARKMVSEPKTFMGNTKGLGVVMNLIRAMKERTYIPVLQEWLGNPHMKISTALTGWFETAFLEHDSSIVIGLENLLTLLKLDNKSKLLGVIFMLGTHLSIYGSGSNPMNISYCTNLQYLKEKMGEAEFIKQFPSPSEFSMRDYDSNPNAAKLFSPNHLLRLLNQY